MEEGRRGNKTYYDQDDEDLQMRIEFRKPRDSLLNVVAEYYATCQPRLRELRKMVSDPSFRPPELLDHKSHNVSTVQVQCIPFIAHLVTSCAPDSTHTGVNYGFPK